MDLPEKDKFSRLTEFFFTCFVDILTVLYWWILLFWKWRFLAFFVMIWLLTGSIEVPKFTQPRQLLFTKQTFETRKKRFQNAGIEKTFRFCRFDGFSRRKKASKWIGTSHRKGKSSGPIRKFNFQWNITEFKNQFCKFSTKIFRDLLGLQTWKLQSCC